MAIAIAWLAAIVGLVRRRPNVAFGMAWAAVAVSPYLLARWPQLNVFAERYLYVPSIGVLAAVVVPVASRVERERGLAAGAAAVAVACGLIGLIAIDAARATDWRTEESIYTDVLAQSERAELVRNNLALHYLETGRAAEGIEIQRELLAMNPGFRSGWHNLGLLLLSAGRRSEALDAFQRSAEREPRNPATALNLGYTYDLLGERVRAVEQYFRTIALAPRDARPWYNLAVIALEQGQTGNARTALAKVLELTPDDHAARALAERLDSATQSASASPEGTTLDRCLAGRAAAEEGRYAEAVAKLRTAAWLDERSPLPHHYLANVMYLTGRHRLAYYHQREALARAPDNELYRKNLRALEEGLAQ